MAKRYLTNLASNLASNSVSIHRLGYMDFMSAFKFQEKLMSDPLYSDNDHIIFVEHPSIYTCGRRHFRDIDQYINNNYNDNNQLNKNEILCINRGGNITFHGDGQLVIYPIFDLKKKHFKKDLYWFLRKIENIIIELLLNEYKLNEKYNFNCFHDNNYTGVWLKHIDDNIDNIEYKISAIGIGVTKWKTFHGISLNINTNLDNFNRIIPCGIKEVNKSVINLSDIISDRISSTLHDDDLSFNSFTTNMIDKIVLLFEQEFNLKNTPTTF